MIQLKDARGTSYTRIARHSYENFTREYSRVHGKAVEDVRKEILPPADVQNPDDYWYSIHKNDEEAGYLRFFLPKNAKEVFGYDIFIYPEFRSKGIGRATLQQVRELLTSLGIEIVKINVFKDNAIAKGLYDKLGFQVVEEHERHFEMQIAIS